MYVFPVGHKFFQYRHFVDLSCHSQTFGPNVLGPLACWDAELFWIWLYVFDWGQTHHNASTCTEQNNKKTEHHASSEIRTRSSSGHSLVVYLGVSAHFKACRYLCRRGGNDGEEHVNIASGEFRTHLGIVFTMNRMVLVIDDSLFSSAFTCKDLICNYYIFIMGVRSRTELTFQRCELDILLKGISI
jgi:hypothetical protein